VTGPGGSRRRACSAYAPLVVGGAAWVFAAVAGDGAGDGTARFYISEVIWLGAQAALLVGMVALWRSRPHGEATAGDVGFATAGLGRAAFVGAEVAALATGATQEALLPIAALLTAVGMVVAGVAVVRAREWEGWHRIPLLAAGAYPFLAMFPFAAAADDGPPVLTLGAWGLAFVALGVATQAEARRMSDVVAHP